MGRLLAPLGPHAVHLCIDLQNLFGPDGPWVTPWMERILPLSAEIVAHAPQRTIFTRFIPPQNKQAARGSWRAYYEKWECVTRERLDPYLLELAEPLNRFIPPAQVLDRQTYGAFTNGALQQFLDGRQVDTLVISGGETDVCVLATVLGAVDMGYRVVLAQDALCSSADLSHDAMINLYTQRFDIQIEVALTNEILERWKVLG